MRKIKIFLMAFAVLLLIVGAVNASELDGIADNINDNMDDFNSDEAILSSEGDILSSEGDILSADDDILCSEGDILSADDDILCSEEDVISSDKGVLCSVDDSQSLESQKDFNGNSFSQLQSEINDCLNHDVINLNNDITQTGAASILIQKSLTINGRGHTIDAQEMSGIFSIRYSTLILKNIIFKNAKGGTFGAIAIYNSECSIINCSFENNNVEFDGAAISIVSGSLNVSDSIFKDNKAKDNGGAIYSTEDIYIDNCTFINNSASQGGAIHSLNCNLLDCKFINNSAVSDGGTIYSSKANITNCTFKGGSSSAGSAVYLIDNDGKIELCTFVNNTATNNGGAIFIQGASPSQSTIVTIEHCTLEDNYAGDIGGAIYSDSENYTVNNCTFINNSAENGGGAIFNNNSVIISNSTFSSNSAEKGGAIYSEDYCSLDTSAFKSNSAIDAGGAIYSKNSLITLYLCNFTGNNAKDGGSIYCNGTMGIIEFSQFLANNASNNGGALFLDSVNQSNISFSSFFNNSASLEGGAIYCINSNSSIDGSVLLNNTAIQAGAIYYLNSTDNISNSNFDYNSAFGDGGAIIFNDSNSSIRNSYFNFNVAGKKGGAIYWTLLDQGPQCNISKSTFLNNKAESYSITGNFSDGILTLMFSGWNNYVNAIYADSPIDLLDVTYWNGDIANTYYGFYVYPSGQNISLEIYDSQNALIRNVTFLTNSYGQQYFSTFDLDDGYYTYKAYHLDDLYYTYVEGLGNFTINRSTSSISLNISDNAELFYGSDIPFEVINRTSVNVLITNEDGSIVYRNGSVGQYNISIDVNLEAMDDYYKITVYNLPNGIFQGSQDSKLFKVLKANSSVSINPIDDVLFGKTVNVTFNVENRTNVELILYDENNNALLNLTPQGDTVVLPILPAGLYNLTVLNFGNPNVYNSNDSIRFNVLKAENQVNISANDVAYGTITRIVISANANGNYTLDINGSLFDVEVKDGEGILELVLPIGDYYINGTFNNSNYNTSITNATCRVSKADLTVLVKVEDVFDGKEAEIKIYSLVNGMYLLDVNGTLMNVSVYRGIGKTKMQLPVGEYYANVSFSNPNYNIVINNTTFKVYELVYGGVENNSANGGNIDFNVTVPANGTSNGKFVSRFSGNKNISMYYFDGSKYSFKVYGDNGKLVGANQVVVVKLNKKTYKLKTNKNGVISLKIPKTVKPGKYTITASYKGQTIKNTIKVKKILSSKKLVKVKKTAKKLILKAKLKKKLKGKKITFKFRGKKYTAKTNKKGIAKVKINKKVIKKLKRGKKYKLLISYYKTSLKAKVRLR